MATLLPTGIVQGYGPYKTVQAARFDYNSASGSYTIANVPPKTFVEQVACFVATIWTGGGAACLGVGDTLATRSYFAQVTIATAGGYNSFRGAGANALGTYYPSANSVKVFYTQDSSDTQGVAYFYTTMIYHVDLSIDALAMG